MERVEESCTEIIIVRHGETEWNALRKMQGQADIDLNEVGRQQAQAVAERLSREADISAIFSSDLKRAHDTAELIAAKFHGLEVVKDIDLRERHIGEFEGLPYHDLSNLNPKAHDVLRSWYSGLDNRLPGGESRRELYNRCTSSLQRIAQKHRGERVIVVTHGVVISTLCKRAHPERNYEGIANASIAIIQVSEGDVWFVKSWNDVTHLNEKPLVEEQA